jgi:DNA invertase Pin-like site-specific DNA recombinase
MAAAKAVSYLRVSGKGQIDGDGFDRQRDTVQRFAKRQKLALVDEYRDEGVSGTKETDDRPGLAALLDRIESNGVRIVIVENASRLARDLMVQEIILDQFRKLGVQVFEADGGNDLTVADDSNPTATLIRQVLGAVSQFEKTVLVLKLRAARQRIRRTAGRCEGRKPFGNTPAEANVLNRMRQLRRKPTNGDRLSYAAIAEQLNAEQAATRQGKPWRASSVQAILKRIL